MKKHNPQKQPRNPTMDLVIAGFRMQGISFYQYCEDNNLDRRNAQRAVLGTWSGKKAKVLRNRIMQDSKAKQLMRLQHPVSKEANSNSASPVTR